MTRDGALLQCCDAMQAIGKYSEWLILSCRESLEGNYSFRVADALWHDFIAEARGEQ